MANEIPTDILEYIDSDKVTSIEPIKEPEKVAVAYQEPDKGLFAKQLDYVEYLSTIPENREPIESYTGKINTQALNSGVPVDSLNGGTDFVKQNGMWFQNLYTPDKLAEINKLGPIGMLESGKFIYREGLEDVVPYADAISIAKDVNVFRIMQKIQKDPKSATPEEQALIYKYLDTQAQMQIRGFSLGGNIVYNFAKMPKFAIELATVAASWGGLAPVAVGGKVAAQVAKKGIKELIEKGIQRTAQVTARGLLITAAPKTLTTGYVMYAKLGKNITNQYVNDSFAITDKGQAFFKEASIKPTTAVLKAIGQTWIENSTEMAGAFLFKPFKNQVTARLPKGFMAKLDDLTMKTKGVGFAKGVATWGYDGLLEELGEERLSDFLTVATGLDGEITPDKLANALFHYQDPDRWLIDIGVIGLFGGTSLAGARVLDKVTRGQNPEQIQANVANVQALSETQKQNLVNGIERQEIEADGLEYTEQIQNFKAMVGEAIPSETLDANIAIWDAAIQKIAIRTGKTRTEISKEILPVVKRMEAVPAGGLFQSKETPMFYSNLQKTLSEKMPNIATAEQVRGIVKDIKQEEKDWSGLDEFLKANPKPTKEALLNHLKSNEMKLEEITKEEGKFKELNALNRFRQESIEKYGTELSYKWPHEAINELARLQREADAPKSITKFSRWQLSGGENYREVLMMFPDVNLSKDQKELKALNDKYNSGIPLTNEELKRGATLNKLLGSSSISQSMYKGGHWDERNVLAHFRLNDRVDNDGNKVLFVEEIQSDWHQAGRKKGYQGKGKAEFDKYQKEWGKVQIELQEKYKKLNDYKDAVNANEYKDEIKELEKSIEELAPKEMALQEKVNQLSEGARGVPDAPFKKTWHELAFRRIMREAVEKGYDKVGWTTGEQQAVRYKEALLKEVDAIEYIKDKDGSYAVIGTKNGVEKITKENLTESQLSDLIGKDVSKDIIENKGDSLVPLENEEYRGRIEGKSFQVGGEGMKGFYDKILVDYANKFGKKFDSKVEDITLERQDMQFELKDGEKITSFTAHGLEITPQMKESVMAGQPLFQGKRGAFSPEADLIAIFKNADRSTFIHESAHAFLQYYLKNIPDELDAVFKWATVANKPLTELTDAEYVKLQESFATGFEMYLREGKAPNEKLADAFERFKEWLITIYQTIQSIQEAAGLKIELNDDIRKFYDEMLSIPADRVAEIDSDITIEQAIEEQKDQIEERDITLFQNAKQKLEEIKKKRKELIDKYGAEAKLELEDIQAEVEALKVISGISTKLAKEQAVKAFNELPISEIFREKIRLTEESKGMMDRYGVPISVRTKNPNAQALDEWADVLNMTEEQVLEELHKIGSKTQFINEYVKKNIEQTEFEMQGEDIEGSIQKIEERLKKSRTAEVLKTRGMPKPATPQSIYDLNLLVATEKDSAIRDAFESAGEFASSKLTPISTRLGDISPKLKEAIRKFDFRVLQGKKKGLEVIRPFVEKFHKLKLEDMKTLDLALKLSDIIKINEIVDRVGMRNEYDAVVKLLEEIYDETNDVQLGIGYLINYFPRRVKDPIKFMSYIKGTPQWSQIQAEIEEKEKEIGRLMTDEEKAGFISTLIRGFGDGKILLSKPSFTKERMIIELTPDLNLFYKDSAQAIMDYVGAMADAIEARRFFGKSEDDIDKSIGHVVNEMIKQGDITVQDEKLTKQLLKSRFNTKGVSGIWSLYRDFNYLTLLGSPISAITQLEDMGVTLYKAGVFNTLKGLAASLSGKGITVKDLGFEQISQEFTDAKSSSKAVEKLLKWTGFAFMDKLGKETFVNATYEKYKDLANSNNQEFKDQMDDIFGEESGQVMDDLKTGNISQNVKYLMYNELAELQPVSLSEMPEGYTSGGNSRVFYALKSFTIKRMDFMRREVIEQIGDNKLQGVANLGRLMFFLMLTGASADWIKDFLLGRSPEPTDYMVNNIFKMFGFQKWVLYQARREGLMSALGRQILPPFKLFDDIYKDVGRMFNKKPRDIKDWDTWSNIPMIGKFYYWWFGQGSEKKK